MFRRVIQGTTGLPARLDSAKRAGRRACPWGSITFTALIFILLILLSCNKVKESMTEKRVLVQEPKIIQPETGTENNMQLLTEDEQRSFKGCVEPQTLDQAEVSMVIEKRTSFGH